MPLCLCALREKNSKDFKVGPTAWGVPRGAPYGCVLELLWCWTPWIRTICEFMLHAISPMPVCRFRARAKSWGITRQRAEHLHLAMLVGLKLGWGRMSRTHSASDIHLIGAWQPQTDPCCAPKNTKDCSREVSVLQYALGIHRLPNKNERRGFV